MSATATLVNALRILARDIQSDDGVAFAAISEAADRLEEQQARIKRLEEAGDLFQRPWCGGIHAREAWAKAKEAKS